jgi:uncharacterized protein (DUF1697 family)
MNDLRPVFEAAGCRNVETYLQSGNVLFDQQDDAALGRAAEAVRAIAADTTRVIFRSLTELEAIVAADPFRDYLGDRRLKLYVVFLETAARATPNLPVVSVKDALELIDVSGREAYVVSRPRASLMYGFPNAFVEAHLGIAATSRNWSTVTKLVEFAIRR